MLNSSFIGPLEQGSFGILPYVIGLIIILLLLFILKKIRKRKNKIPAQNIASQQQLYCNNCGSKIENDQSFCKTCGNKINN